jgi:hypothetical protein
MSAKQKPGPEIVIKAARFLKHPEEATLTDIKSMAARLVDDSKTSAAPEKPTAMKPKVKNAAAPAPSASNAARKSRAA